MIGLKSNVDINCLAVKTEKHSTRVVSASTLVRISHSDSHSGDSLLLATRSLLAARSYGGARWHDTMLTVGTKIRKREAGRKGSIERYEVVGGTIEGARFYFREDEWGYSCVWRGA